MRPLILITALMWSLSSFAVVDMKTANYADNWVDMIAPGTGYDLRIQRTYNSRTIYSGIFGFGWCSDFETRAEVTPEGNLKVIECGAGAEIIYTPKNFDKSKINSSVAAILAEVKKRNPVMNEKSLTALGNDLRDDGAFREEFARRVGIKGTVDGNTVYLANGRANETVERQTMGFRRALADGTFQNFDGSGKLIAMYDRNGNSLKLVYEKERLTGVVDNNGRRLTFTYQNSGNRIKKITGPNNLAAIYTLKGEDLVEVTNAWKSTYTYKYDDVHNLTDIKLPNGKTKKLTYNKDKDWVTGFVNESGCVESYEYKMDPEDPKNHYSSIVIKKCGDQVTNRSSYEFIHKNRADGVGSYLYRVKSDVNGMVTDIVYHEIFGRPVSMLRGNFKTEYTYYDNGLVKSKREAGRSTGFEYKNACNKVSKIQVEYSDPNPKSEKKSSRKVETAFTYDAKKCNLTYAENSDGQTVKLQYDSRGRIATIEDQSKKLVKIKYEDKFGKPEFVTRPGLGTIKVSYKSDGEIGSVNSKEGPRVAVQVASIFNNLLELIAPATAETNL